MPSHPRLTGKHAIVTGSSKGIGAGIAKALAAEGASVVVNYSSSKDAAEQVVAAITAAGGKAVAIHGSVSSQEEIKKLIAESVAAFGPIDILVNNAGVFDFVPLGSITEEHFHRLFNTNVLGTLLAIQEAVPHFNPAGGSIVNISSNVSTKSPAGSGVYNATKSAVDGLTRTFSKELGARKIRVNSANPGPVESDGVQGQGLIDTFRKLGENTILGRIGQPEDVARGVVYLASDDSAWVTGTCLYITGGNK